MAEITVRLLAGDDQETSREMLREFSSEVAHLDGVVLRSQEPASTDSGNRGDPVTLVAFALAAVKSGALTALVQTIGSYLNRDRRTEIEISTADGQTVRVSSQNFNLFELEESIRRLLPVTDDRPFRKIAFLVANDRFPEDVSIPPLHFTQNDAEALKVVLEDEACGFKVYPYLNQPSHKLKADLNRICRQLTEHDTILFYYAGHGKLDANELCFATIDTTSESLEATSLRAEDILRYLRKTLSKRRVVILDCCHSGVIADRFRGNDLESTVNSLSRTYGTYILTASSATGRAEEREKDGHGVFTKALLDCLREDWRESITINDLYSYTFARLSMISQQTPRLTILEQVGEPIEIGNYQARHEQKRREARGQLIATARIKFGGLQAAGVFTKGQVDSILDLLVRDEATLLPHDRAFRNKVICYVKGEIDFFITFGTVPQFAKHPLPPEPAPPGPDEDGYPQQPLFPAAPVPPEPLRTLTGHTHYVDAVAFSPYGRTLASGGYDNTIKLWDSASGQLLRTLIGHTWSVWSVAFSPDGRTLASGSNDKTIKLWDSASGELLRTLNGHTSPVGSVAFSPDRRTLVSGSWDKTIKLWDAASGQLLRTLTGHTNSVWRVVFSPDGRTLASGSNDDTIKLWDYASGQLLRTLIGHTHSVYSVAFSPDGRTLASGSRDKTIKLWDSSSGEMLRTLTGHTNYVDSVAFSPDGRSLASGSNDDTIKLWDSASGQLLRTLTGHTHSVWSVAISPDGRTLASGSKDKTIKLWDVSKVNEPGN